MTRSSDTPMPFRARCTDDLVAMVPIVLGFHPASSAVVLTFGGPRPFHARVDLPEDPDDIGLVVATLLAPARRHQVEKAAVLLYADESPLAAGLATEMCEEFQSSGIEVIDVVRVADGHWHALLPGRPPEHYTGVRCEPTTHPFAARAVVEGHVTLSSREEVRRSLAADPVAVRRLRDRSGPGPWSALSAPRVLEVVGGCVDTGTPCDDETAVGLALAVQDGAVRDLVWCALERDEAPRHVDFWRDVVRRLPDELVAAPAAVLAFCAWLAGDGALAWCAVDRARAVEPGHSLAGLVDDLLASATPPSAWSSLRDRVDEDGMGADGVEDVA